MPMTTTIKKHANLMFGFIINQPLHVTLRQMRLATIVLLGVSCHIMYLLVDILERAVTLSTPQTVVVVGTLASAVVAAIWKGVDNLSKGHEADAE